MNTSALLMMVIVESIVVIFTGWFFWKVLTTKPRSEDQTDD